MHIYFLIFELWLEAVLVGSVFLISFLSLIHVLIGHPKPLSYPPLPLPSPVYLRIQAACYKAAHLFGALGLGDQPKRDLESDPDAAMIPEFT
jgi:hypothetical protein